MSLVNDNLHSFISDLQPLCDGILGEIQAESYEKGIPIIENEVVRFVKFLLSISKPKKILEIGTAVGFSASLMSDFLQDGGHITTIDRYKIMIDKAKANFDRQNLNDKITILEGDAGDVLPTLNEKFDIIFMDAGKGQYIKILPEVYRLLNTGGIIIADDVLQEGEIWRPKEEIKKRQRTIYSRMREFLIELSSNDNFTSSILTIGDGLLLAYKKK